MASPDYHRRQAEMLTQISKATRDPGMAAELFRLAEEHSAWARQGEGLISRNSKSRPRAKRDGGHRAEAIGNIKPAGGIGGGWGAESR